LGASVAQFEICAYALSRHQVLAFYTGFAVDLQAAWEPYKAARAALANVLDKSCVAELCQRQASLAVQVGARSPARRKIGTALCVFTDVAPSSPLPRPPLVQTKAELDRLLVQGVLTEDLVLDNTRKLMHTVRQANVSLRFFLLHRAGPLGLGWPASAAATTAASAAANASSGTVDATQRRLVEQIRSIPGITTDFLLTLLLQAAQFESLFRDLLTQVSASAPALRPPPASDGTGCGTGFQVLAARESRWLAYRTEAAGRCTELAEYFSGEKALTRVGRAARCAALPAWCPCRI
jgi:WASH complex subunit strumpellin